MLPKNVALMDRMEMLFTSARYYGEGRPPSLVSVACLMADLRTFVFAAKWDNDQLNKLVKDREAENAAELHALGIDPVALAATRAHRHIEPIPEISEADKRDAQAALKELEKKRQNRLRRMK